jgi:glycosyltransferase involved in cell wall biosynthesis
MRARLLAIIEARVITGPARNLLEFVPFGLADGLETTIVTFLRNEVGNVFTDNLRRLSIPFLSVSESGPFDFSTVQKLRDLVLKFEPTLIQTHAVKSHFLLRLSKIPKSVPWVAFHHGYTSTSPQARLYNQLDRWSLNSAARIITVSNASLGQLRAKGVDAGKVSVVHNAVPPDYGVGTIDSSQIEALRASLNIPRGRKIVLSVGRLSREKNQISLVVAMGKLLKSTCAHLVIVGDGPDQELILQRIRSLGLSDRIILAGHHDNVLPFYRLADVLVISSSSEGSPNTLLEAMATSVPVVATAVGGIPEMVVDGSHALLVDPDNTDQMAASIAKVFFEPENTKLRVAKAKDLAKQKYSPSVRAKVLGKIYSEVAASSPI